MMLYAAQDTRHIERPQRYSADRGGARKAVAPCLYLWQFQRIFSNTAACRGNSRVTGFEDVVAETSSRGVIVKDSKCERNWKNLDENLQGGFVSYIFKLWDASSVE